MGALSALAFGAPWILAALAALPVIWWLLRVTPPAPRRQAFPAIRLLYDLRRREETPQRTPWWLLLLRLVLAALVILALSRPVYDPGEALPGQGPVLIAVDDGWASARDWPQRRATMLDAVSRAERAGRPVVLLATAPAADGAPPAPSGLLRPAEARARVEAMAPKAWPVDREAAAAALDGGESGFAPAESGYALWLSDGLAAPGAAALAAALRGAGGLRVLVPDPLAMAHLVEPPAAEGAGLVVPVHRAAPGGAESVEVRLTGADGRLLDRQTADFGAEATTAEARFDLPVELRNEAARLDLAGQATAGATVLLDDRWRRRPVGILSESTSADAQPLLSATYYLDRALAPYSAVRTGALDGLLDPTAGGLAALLLPDIGTPSPAERQALDRFMEDGGVVVRFAGPLMAANPDTFVPVPLRFGDRALTGALTWSEPQPLAPFPPESPFFGLAVPDDVIVRRQVLAEPTVDLAQRTWARLADGTPLITAEPRGQGHLVLVHTTAGPDWSSLPLSGLFVQMLRRVAALGAGVAGGGADRALEPVRVLDGFGRTQAPTAGVRPIAAGTLGDLVPGPRHPPGWYGTEDSRRAVNLGDRIAAPAPLGPLPDGVRRAGYDGASALALAPWLLAAAMALTVADLAVALLLRGWGRLPGRRRAASAAAAGALAALALGIGAGAAPARAQGAASFALRAAHETLLAYVETGIPSVDATSRAGLDGLAAVLRQRTAVEATGAIGVDPALDDLAFFPMLYWPVVPEQPALAPETVDRLNAFMRNGGTIVFDTRDQAQGGTEGALGGGPGGQRLRTLAEDLDVPPLTPVPPEHVLTKAFYLMQDFPGRYAGGQVWVQDGEDTVNDGVSPVVIGANDWAGAWAVDEAGRPLNAVVPGGERQREMARRFGVNLVMYALTGNYKADQVHVPAILERLGQ